LGGIDATPDGSFFVVASWFQDDSRRTLVAMARANKSGLSWFQGPVLWLGRDASVPLLGFGPLIADIFAHGVFPTPEQIRLDPARFEEEVCGSGFAGGRLMAKYALDPPEHAGGGGGVALLCGKLLFLSVMDSFGRAKEFLDSLSDSYNSRRGAFFRLLRSHICLSLHSDGVDLPSSSRPPSGSTYCWLSRSVILLFNMWALSKRKPEDGWNARFHAWVPSLVQRLGDQKQHCDDPIVKQIAAQVLLLASFVTKEVPSRASSARPTPTCLICGGPQEYSSEGRGELWCSEKSHGPSCTFVFVEVSVLINDC